MNNNLLKLLIILILKTITVIANHETVNNSDIVITYGGHSDTLSQYSDNNNNNKELKDPSKPSLLDVTTKTETEFKTEGNDVVFIPNAREGSEEYLVNESPARTVGDIISGGSRNLYDVMSGYDRVKVNTDSPNDGKDVIFVTGKNDDKVQEVEAKEQARKEKKNTEKLNKPLNCRNLNCNSTIDYICGGKIEHNKWRYRFFMNECYFRKVNCGFKYEINRFQEVNKEKCDNIGTYYADRPYYYGPIIHNNGRTRNSEPKTVNRRMFGSRRSTNVNLNGTLCSHSCPITCPEDYAPECAISATGQKKMFLNHCKMDYNSCSFSIVWLRRPLSDCIGNKKAELRENRAFISWMQKIGIVDHRGKLVYS